MFWSRLRKGAKERKSIRELEHNVMAALDSLNANVTTLNVAVAALVTAANNKPPAPGSGIYTEAQVQAASDSVGNLVNTVQAATTALTPAPAPAAPVPTDPAAPAPAAS